MLLEGIVAGCLVAPPEVLKAGGVKVYVLVVANGLIWRLHLEFFLRSCIWICAFGSLICRVKNLMVVSLGIMNMFHPGWYLSWSIGRLQEGLLVWLSSYYRVIAPRNFSERISFRLLRFSSCISGGICAILITYPSSTLSWCSQMRSRLVLVIRSLLHFVFMIRPYLHCVCYFLSKVRSLCCRNFLAFLSFSWRLFALALRRSCQNLHWHIDIAYIFIFFVKYAHLLDHHLSSLIKLGQVIALCLPNELALERAAFVSLQDQVLFFDFIRIRKFK